MSVAAVRRALVLVVSAGLAVGCLAPEVCAQQDRTRPTPAKPPTDRRIDRAVPGAQPGGKPTPNAQPNTQPNTQPATQPRPEANPGKREGPQIQPVPKKGQEGEQPKEGTRGEIKVVPDGAVPAQPSGDDELVTLSAFTEPVTLQSLVDMVASTLEINIATKGDVPGSVVFNAPVPVKKSELLALLDQLLEQQNWTITKDKFGFYTVHPTTELRPIAEGDRTTTRVFSTPNIRPSALKAAIEAQFQGNPSTPVRLYSYMDELGIIVATDTPRRLEAAEDIIKKITGEFGRAKFIRLELVNIAAPVARERALHLIGQLAQPVSSDPNQAAIMAAQQAQQQANNPGGVLANMGERLTIDPQGNALFFRGLPEEVAKVREVLAIIDQPNTLQPKQYFAGSAAKQIADLARQQGLGEVTTIARANEMAGLNYQETFAGLQQTSIGGPTMVVDESSGNIIYYATPAQHERLDQLIKELDTKAERVVLEPYKLRNSDAQAVADILQSLISNSMPLGTSSLLPGGQQQNRRPITQPQPGQEGAGSESFGLDPTAFVIADIDNNQVIVKARAGQQAEFKRLIERLDVRRPQVYIEAMIVAVNADDKTRLAFETQLINANGTGGVLSTNFGLSTFGTTGQPILNPRIVSPSSAITAAIIKSDQVPIIMNALASETNSRIVSSPQLLVDDNEEANVVSLDQQPYTNTTQTSGNPSTTAFAGYADAGTKLKVTPHIADSNYLRLEYEVELSSFTGESPGAGVPPPKQTNNVDGNITIPSDATVIVGGLTVDSKTKTVAKIPFFGDIPLLGLLGSDTRDGARNTTLYVFLTPRIVRDPGFEDLRLLTEGPYSASRLPRKHPTLQPSMIDLTTSQPTIGAPETAAPETGMMPLDQSPAPGPTQAPASALPLAPTPGKAQPVVRPITPVRDSDKTEMNPD